MGFLLLSELAGTDALRKQEDAILHKLGCKVCPLAKLDNRHPDMPPSGTDQPLIYCLGEAPGAQEDEQDRQFVGVSGQLLRDHIPRAMRDRIRWNNCVRTRPPGNRDPEHTELECCRPSVEQDIARTKPKAVFGFGNVPLRWVSGFTGVQMWRGRKMPVKIAGHACWFYPMYHPSYILHMEGIKRREVEEKRMFQLDLRRACAEITSLPPPEVHDPASVHDNIELILDTSAKGLRRLETLLRDAAHSPAVGLDYETHGLRPYAADARVLSAAVFYGDRGVAFPFDHPAARWSEAHRRDLQQLWVRFLTHCKARKVVHNLAFEMEWTAEMFDPGLLRKGRWEDTANQASIIDERTGRSKPGCFSLEFLVQQYFGFNIKAVSALDRERLIEEPLTDVLRYNGGDAKYHLRLWEKQCAEIDKQGLQYPYELALRRVPTVVLSQIKGAPVDQATVVQLRDRYAKRIKELKAEIVNTHAARRFPLTKGRPFNPESVPDNVLMFTTILPYKEYCTTYITDSNTGERKEKVSVDASVLGTFADKEPLVPLILELRKVVKLKSTYIDALDASNEDSVVYPSGLIHTQFNTFFAETGRLSAEDPNLQNFPSREDEAKEVRRCIRATPGDYILSFDYGQIEARVIAMFTKDKRFVDALWSGFDVHGDWAKRIATDYPERIGGRKFLSDKGEMKKFRTDIKNQWTFPLFFGAKLESVAGYLNIPPDVLQPHYKQFWDEFSDVRKWQQELLNFYDEHGYVECLTGRRRRGPLSINQIFNSPVQGTAAEIVLDGMSRLSESGDPEMQPEINVHDDLTFLRIKEDRFDAVVEKVLDYMLDVPFEWAKIVPISVELKVGYNWMKMEEVGTFSSDKWFAK